MGRSEMVGTQTKELSAFELTLPIPSISLGKHFTLVRFSNLHAIVFYLFYMTFYNKVSI